jgi:excisionase family DNA binding protein
MPEARFLKLTDVAEALNISASQTMSLVRSGELPAIKIGGRGQWRVEASQLEAYIERMYDEARTFVDQHPFTEPATSDDESRDVPAG